VGYYRGDGGNYYRGDYYRGDPFLGAILGGVARKVAGKVARWAVGRSAGARGTRVVMDQLPGVGVGIGIGRGFGPPNMPALPALPGMPALPGGKEPRGTPKDFRPNRARRMNPLNPRALRRALRRAEGFEKFAKKTVNALYKTVDGRRVRTYKKKSG
jgi:hypothetical protein